jgi:hypothetical protein
MRLILFIHTLVNMRWCHEHLSAGSRINLAPAELWELDDQAALDTINGAQPLPFEEVS